MTEVRKLEGRDAAVLDKVSRWMYDWWGKYEGKSLDAVKSFMENSMQQSRMPQTFGVFDDGEIVGMYQFTLTDAFAHPEIYPWLANVYVDEAHRGKGYSRVMLESVAGFAKDLCGYDELFLITHHVGLYEKFGWQYLHDIDLCDGNPPNRLYRIDIG